jgi:hypothetical protein
MKLSLHKIRLRSLIFIALSIGSASYLLFATLNYLDFYPSLASLHPSTLKVTLQGATSANPLLLAEVSVENPSSYSGFSLKTLHLKLYFTPASNYTDFQSSIGSPEADTDVTASLGPHSRFDSSMGVPLNSQQVASLLSFNSTYDGQITVHALLTVDIITFLEPVTGRIPVQNEDDLPLS